MRIEQLRNHGFWTQIEQAELAISGYTDEVRHDAAFEETADKISYFKWVLEQSDPNLIAAHELDQATQQIQQIANYIKNSNGNPKALRQIDAHASNFLAVFPYPRVKKLFRSEKTEIINEFRYRMEELKNETELFQSRMSDQRHEFEAKVEGLQRELESVSEKIGKNEARVDTQFENWASKNSAEMSQRLAELTERFSEEQTKRQHEFQKQLDRISANLDHLTDFRQKTTVDFTNTVNELQTEMSQWREKSQSEANEFLDQIKNIYQIVGQTSLAGDFEIAAKRETFSGNIFATLAAVFFVMAPIFFAWQWGTTQLAHFDVEALVLKFSAALAFLVPAAYFGNTSRRHHRVATSLRSLGIRVATFDAYLANFEKTERNQIKREMAELFFSANITPDTIRTTTPKEMEKLLGVVDTTLSQFETHLKSLFPK